MSDRCESCDRPVAPDALYAHPGGCECAGCVSHCWGRADCEPHDWRAEALELRAKLAALGAETEASK